MKNMTLRSPKFEFLIAVVVSVLVSPFIHAGQETRNGEGIAEQSFAYAYLNLERIYSLCKVSSFCLRSQEERNLLSAIHAALPREYASPHQLRFESGEKNPSRFLINGQFRVAVTGNQVGNPIYINTDLLYRHGSDNRLEYLDFNAAVGILTHELGHHQGEKDETKLDLLGAQLRAFSLEKMERIQLDTYADDSTDVDHGIKLALMALHSDVPYAHCCTEGPESWLLVTDGRGIYSFDSLLSSRMKCPIGPKNPSGNEAKVRGFRLYNLRWERWHFASPKRIEKVFPLRASLLLECQNPRMENGFGGIYHETDLDLVIDVHLKFHFEYVRKKDDYLYPWFFQEEKTELRLTPRN